MTALAVDGTIYYLGPKCPPPPPIGAVWVMVRAMTLPKGVAREWEYTGETWRKVECDHS
jgi:hypothetical protein